MSTWSAHQVGKWAAAAGFAGGSLHDAVAVALAASQGADHYKANPSGMPGHEQRGLFAIRVDHVGGDPAGLLFHPQHNTDAARALFLAHGEDWEWHPAWLSGAAIELVPSVRLILRSPPKLVFPFAAASFAEGLHNARRLSDAMTEASRTVRAGNA